jgi:DNA topoisomerase I
MRLRRWDIAGPGIVRRKCARGFRYAWSTGKTVVELGVLSRVKALVIPPARKNVWICPWPHGHIQAVGTDAAGLGTRNPGGHRTVAERW